MKPSTLLLTAAVVVSNVAGNYALSWGMKHAPADAGPIVSLFEPWVIAGIVLLISWTLMRIQLLGMADLSYVLPITAIGYVLNAVIAAAFLHEQVSPQRWAGTLLIVAGAGLTAFTPATTDATTPPTLKSTPLSPPASPPASSSAARSEPRPSGSGSPQ